MNIIWITLESILPANSGGRIGIFRRLEYISQLNNIYLFYTMDNFDDMKYIKDLKKYCKEVHGFERKKISGEIFCGLLKAPYTVASRKNADMIKAIEMCLQKNKIDLINVDSPHMGLNLLEINTNVPIVINQHNVEWKVYENIASATSNLLKSFVYKVDAKRFKNFEEYLYAHIRIALMTFVSNEDRDYFRKKYPELYTELVPVGAIDQKCKYDWNGKSNRIIFVGKMSYAPNIEAAVWFAKNIFPKIKSKICDAEFIVVGKDPTNEVLELGKINGVTITGAVDSVDDYYVHADLIVIPLLHGGGVKVKLLEGLGYSVPIVTTAIGVQGTIFNKDYLLIANTVEDMVEQCTSFLSNREKYKELYENTFKVFKNNYTWDAVGKFYNGLLNQVVSKKDVDF